MKTNLFAKTIPAPDRGHDFAHIAGTLCGGAVQGTFAAKVANCIRCDFFLSPNYDRQRKL